MKNIFKKKLNGVFPLTPKKCENISKYMLRALDAGYVNFIYDNKIYKIIDDTYVEMHYKSIGNQKDIAYK
jgi:hypothetical protein